MEGGDTGGYSHGVLKSMRNDECRSSFCFVFVCGQSLLSVGTSFPYVGSRFRTWVVIFVCGQLSHGGGGGSLPLPCRCQRRGFPVSKESGGRGVFTHLLVVVAASDMAPQCRWRGGSVGCLSPLVPFVGGVLSSCCCCGMVVICCGCGCGESLLSSVMAADVVFLHCLDGVPVCPGGCRWWVVVWRRWVGVISGRHGWASWVVVGGGGGG